MGKEEAKNQIQRNLWMRGYRVRDYSGIADFDLLVEGKVKVKVVLGQNPRSVHRVAGADVVALFIPGKKPQRLYARPDKTETIDGKQFGVFGSFTKKPQEVFNQ